MLKKIIWVVATLMCSFAWGADSPEIKALKKDMPQDVVLMIDRILECNHWNGEETTNKDRIAKINAAREKFGCDALPADQAALRKRYQNNYEVKNRLNNAEQIFY
ncbi:MAG: hypothetical protein ABW044_04340 [Cellvibrio sp.]